MGLPEINIEFKKRAETAIARSENGIVALILRDDTKSGDSFRSYKYSSTSDYGVSSQWTAANQKYLRLAFECSPKYVLVERIAKEDDYDTALERLGHKKWNWLAVPGVEEANAKTIADWIIAQRAAKKTYKAVLPNYAANHEGIVNFTTDGIKHSSATYTTAEYCAMIAGLLATLPMTEGATYQTIANASEITESETPDDDINAGKFILINDGEKIKVGRGVTSLTTVSGNKTEDMKKIKIVEAMDLIRDDITASFEENYINQVNSHTNKMLFVNAVNQYFKQLVNEGVLYDEYDNKAFIDVDAQRTYLASKYDVSDMSDLEIELANTGSRVFVGASIQLQDCIEDLDFAISLE